MAGNYSLRPALQEDAAYIRDLIRRVGINPMSLDWHRFILAVDEGGRRLGCGQLKPHGPDVIELASIAVEPDYRGHGIASSIIEHLLAQGPRPLYLTCRSRLGPFYEKWGFRVLPPEEMPPYFRRLTRVAQVFATLARRDERILVMKLQ